jgi:hypothetical protein
MEIRDGYRRLHIPELFKGGSHASVNDLAGWYPVEKGLRPDDGQATGFGRCPSGGPSGLTFQPLQVTKSMPRVGTFNLITSVTGVVR